MVVHRTLQLYSNWMIHVALEVALLETARVSLIMRWR
ncbi:hypothetical protein Pint_06977 [Pistacia integerrima]|uniref:Uncharacterized protein n=1 Tax=Pistacia integerrima TaxID=434235 RepID=A0ACC0Y0M0_9ROSI|nr:hypothetical protein Pint_06977 [Pistacia integerrima]